MRSSHNHAGRCKTQHRYIKDVQDTEDAAHQMIDILNELNPVQQVTALALVQMSVNIQLSRLDRRGEL